LKKSMKKCIADINLFNGPSCRNSNRQYSSNGDWFDDWAVSITKIYTWLLMKPFSNKPCLIPFNAPISFSFDFENSFTTNHIHRRFIRHQIPRPIFYECSELLRHGCSPFRMVGGICKGSRLRICLTK